MSDFGSPPGGCLCVVESKLEIFLLADDSDAIPGSKLSGRWAGEGYVKHKKRVLCHRGGGFFEKSDIKLVNDGGGCYNQIVPKVGGPPKGVGDAMRVTYTCYLDCGACRGDSGLGTPDCNETEPCILCKVKASIADLATGAGAPGVNPGKDILAELWSIWQVHEENFPPHGPPNEAKDSIAASCRNITDLLRKGVGKPKKNCGFNWNPAGHPTTPHVYGEPDIDIPDKDNPECKPSRAEPVTGHGSKVEVYCRPPKRFGTPHEYPDLPPLECEEDF